MIIKVVKNYDMTGEIAGIYKGEQHDFIFDYIFKDGKQIEVLSPNERGEDTYWYLKVLNVKHDDTIYDIIEVEVEETVYNDCCFYKEIDKNTKMTVGCFASSCENAEKDFYKSSLNKNKVLEEISKEEFITLLKKDNKL